MEMMRSRKHAKHDEISDENIIALLKKSNSNNSVVSVGTALRSPHHPPPTVKTFMTKDGRGQENIQLNL